MVDIFIKTDIPQNGLAGGKPTHHQTSLTWAIVLVASLLVAACPKTSVSQAELQRSEGSTSDAVMPPPAARTGEVTLTYLANEGFLLEGGEKAVLVDALFGEGLNGYPSVPPSIRDDLENGRGRFSDIDCVLATHAHADHFSPRAVAGFLDLVPAQFLSTREAVIEVGPLLENRHPQAARWLRPARHQIELVDCGGVRISAMSFHHGRLMVKNLAFLIDLDDLTVLHVGDTEITAEEIRPWGLAELEIDVAILPAWHLTEPSWTPVIEEIGAEHTVAMHLASANAPSSWFGSAGSLDNRIAEIRRQVPGAWIPTKPLEERTFEAAE